MFGAIKKELLFKNEWSAVGSVTPFDSKPDLEDIFSSIRTRAEEIDLFHASGLYGFFPVITEYNEVIILDPSDFHTELISLRFPELKDVRVKSISEYFKPAGDIITLQINTLGPDIDKIFQLPGNKTGNSILSA